MTQIPIPIAEVVLNAFKGFPDTFQAFFWTELDAAFARGLVGQISFSQKPISLRLLEILDQILREAEMLSKEEAEREVAQLLADVDRIVALGDFEAFMNLVHEEAEVFAPDLPPLIGKQAVGEVYSRLFTDFEWDEVHYPKDTQVVGDLVIHRGDAVGVLIPRAEGEEMRFNNKYLQILRRGSDGSLKLWRAAFNANPPDPEQGG